MQEKTGMGKAMRIAMAGAVLILLSAGMIRTGHSAAASSPVPTMTIGTQVWMSSNLNVCTFRNGDSIPQAKTYYALDSFDRLKQAAWSYYMNSSDSSRPYGRLYNWYAVSDVRGLAPEGFHVASDSDWMQLIEATGGREKAGNALKTVKGWRPSTFSNDKANNSSGFSALPGGYQYASGGGFSFKGETGYWWTGTAKSGSQSWVWALYHVSGYADHFGENHANAYAVRCVKD